MIFESGESPAYTCPFNAVWWVMRVSRLGGYEFTVILEAMTNTDIVSKVATNIIQKLSEPLEIMGNQLIVTTSIGISLYPLDTSEADVLIKNADTAMYKAKDTGRNDYKYYSEKWVTKRLIAWQWKCSYAMR
jgi:GGDEF domain-containing protein